VIFGIYSDMRRTAVLPRQQQEVLFPDVERRARSLPVIGEQADISYHGIFAKSVLNGPETTGMGYWSINPYVGCAFGCAYCYARYTHRYAMERAATGERMEGALASDARVMPPWLMFERHILVKQNAAAVLQRALRQGSERHLGLIAGETVVIGTSTDPYQPAERSFRITRGILDTLAQHMGLDIVIITKSPLITRDIDLLTRIGRNSRVSVHLSLITLRRELARRVEPRAPTPESRIRALERLRAAGIDAGINCMPVLPGITDAIEEMDALVKRAAAAGATFVAVDSLRLRSEARQRYLPFIDREFPALSRRYRRTYGSSYNVSDDYRRRLRTRMDELCAKYGVQGHDRAEEVEDAEAELACAEQLALPLV
jgi:DNA repair photolyase